MARGIRWSVVAVVAAVTANGPGARGDDKPKEPPVETSKWGFFELRELLEYQGAWHRAFDGSKVTVEGDNWTWVLAGGKVLATGTLEIISIGPEMTKVDWHHATGPKKGLAAMTILRRQGADTLRLRGGQFGYPGAFEDGTDFKRVRR